MLDPSAYDFCSEFYTVEKVIEVVVNIGGQARQIRIEALHGPSSTARYSTRAYIKEYLTVQPTYPQNSEGFVKKPESVSMWIAYDLPWTARSSADEALAQALGFLGECCRKP
ncbi:hypothetical protein [Roseomonas sp. BN140053]|uniref:hypothetical protein n=1 Tax=Roseomonas sp. BN140053 TaxID=3391898 RepID=UPI0039EC9912